MSSALAGSDLSFTELTSSVAQSALRSGIYYITDNLTLNDPDAGTQRKNGLTVADSATVYIYIPANLTLTVYGKNGTDAVKAGDGIRGNFTAFGTNSFLDGRFLYAYPSGVEASQPGSAGAAATGGGAAIYVPGTAKLVVMGEGTLCAKGGNGGKSSQGAAGAFTILWWQTEYYRDANDYDATPVGWTNDSRYEDKFSIRYGEDAGFNSATTLATLAGAGGTGGSGAGGGGAAVGTDGADGTEGVLGAVGGTNNGCKHPQGYYDYAVYNNKNTTVKSTTPVAPAGKIYIAAQTTGSIAGAGGPKCTTRAEAAGFVTKEPIEVTDRIAYDSAGEVTALVPAGGTSNIYVNYSRQGGNGGKGGDGALFGNGGAGGAGGCGGESAAVAPAYKYNRYLVTETAAGADGTSVTAAAASTQQTLSDGNRPYSTVSFPSGTETSKEYYLKPQATITMPAYNGPVDDDKVFAGWKVKTPASELSNVSSIFTEDVSGLATADGTVYAAGQEVSAAGIYGAVEMEPVFAAKDTCTITKGNYVETVADASGNALSAAYKTQPVTVTAENREGYELTGFTVKSTDTTDPDIEVTASGLSGTFNMPGYAVTVKANYKKKNYDVSVTGGKLTVTDENGTGAETTRTTAQVENTVAFTADDPIAGQYFDHWEFWTDSQQLNAADLDIQYGGKASDTQLTLKMPPKNLMLKAVFENIVTKAILFEDECGFARVDGKRVTAATSGDTVTIAAAAQDEMVFDYWEMFDADGKDITDKLTDAKLAETTFTMPSDVVTLKAHYKPIPAGGGETATIGTGGAAAIGAAAAVGAGVVVSEVAMHVYRNKVIQIGYWPGSRIQLAQLLWSRAGAPEPESDVPFADITEAFGTLTEDDATAQKAARWCVEQGLLDGKVSKYGTERFEPLDHVTHLRVCLTWQDARERGLFDQPAEPQA